VIDIQNRSCFLKFRFFFSIIAVYTINIVFIYYKAPVSESEPQTESDKIKVIESESEN